MKVELEKIKREPDYSGSVQRLYFIDTRYMLCETTTGGSVFDVGTLFHIPESDKLRTIIRHLIYSGLNKRKDFDEVFKVIHQSEKLQEILNRDVLKEIEREGVKTHHIGIVNPETGEVFEEPYKYVYSNLTVVKRFKIFKPEKIFLKNIPLWDYHIYYREDGFVIPLENIVRFGITPDSSVYKRYLKGDKSVLEALNLEDIKPWMLFSVPSVDFTTKYEPQDRAVNYQEALYISGLSGEKFEKLFTLTLFCGIYIHNFFKKAGLTMWDLKLEFAKDSEDIVLVDTVDTDSVRITVNLEGRHLHFNKQAVRDYYKRVHPEWVKAVEKSKEEAKKVGKPFQEILKTIYPTLPKVSEDFLKLQSEKLKVLVDVLTGKEDKARLFEVAKKEIELSSGS